MTIDGTAGVTFPDASVQAKAVPAAPQSMVRLNTANGYGSTNTKIRRFTTTVTNQGTDITYTDSATLGASFTINTSGVYAITWSDNFANAEVLGITNNADAGTLSVRSCAIANVYATSASAGANFEVICSVTAYLPAGTVLWPRTNGAFAAGTSTAATFVLSRAA
jgi:hypothetical protein